MSSQDIGQPAPSAPAVMVPEAPETVTVSIAPIDEPTTETPAPTASVLSAPSLSKKDYESMSKIVKNLTEYKNEEYVFYASMESEAKPKS
jgi:hypothetical protein